MTKPLAYLSGLIFLIVLLLSPQQAASFELKLSEQATHSLLNASQQALIDQWIELTSSPDFSEPEKQAALFIIRNAIQKKELDYFFKEVSKESIKTALKAAGFLLLNYGEVAVILEKIEKESVKRSVDMGLDWLLQREVKIAKGHFDYSFTSYLGNLQKPELQYLLAYHSLNNRYGEVVIEFYSSGEVEPEESTGNVLWLNAAPWDFDTWLAAGNTELPPFIVRIKAEVEELASGGYAWRRTELIEVVFDEPVPDFREGGDLEARLPRVPFVSNYIEEWRERLNKIGILVGRLAGRVQFLREDVEELGRELREGARGVLEAAQSAISRFSPLGGAGLVEPSGVPSEGLEEGVEEEVSVAEQAIEAEIAGIEEALAEDEAEAEAAGGEGGGEDEEEDGAPEEALASALGLGDIQAILNDIAGSIAALNQEVAGLSEEHGEQFSRAEQHIENGSRYVEEGEELAEDSPPLVREGDEGEQEPEVVWCDTSRAFSILPSSSKVIINEVAWMGTLASYNDEWIELKNISWESVDLVGWQLIDKEGQIEVAFGPAEALIPAGGFLLLERTDDGSVPGVAADSIYTGSLRNEDEALYLFDEQCRLQDKVLALPNWPSGDNLAKRTMERQIALGWQTSSESGGTPRGENSRGYLAVYGAGGGSGEGTGSDGAGSNAPNAADGLRGRGGRGGEGEEEDGEEGGEAANQGEQDGQQGQEGQGEGEGASLPEDEEPALCSQDNLSSPLFSPVIINEIAWMGTSASYYDEWFELKNLGSSEVSLEGWQILDKREQIKIVFGPGEAIPAGGFYLLERTDDESVPGVTADLVYPGSLSDNDESLRLFDQECRLVDEALADIGEDRDWPAGSKIERRSMERGEHLAWHTYAGEGEGGVMGTPKAENSPVSQGGEAQEQAEEQGGGEGFQTEQQGQQGEGEGEDEDQQGQQQQQQQQGGGGEGESVPGGEGSDTTPPVAEAGANRLVTINQALTFDGSDSTDDQGIVSYLWDVNDFDGLDWQEPDLTGPTPYFQAGYSLPGSFIVTLQVADEAGNTDTDTLIVLVRPAPLSGEPSPPEPEPEPETPTLEVVINEIGWMGTSASPHDEWLELYNNTAQTIDLNGWSLKAQDGIPDIVLNSVIPAHGFYLLERSDEETISDIAADQLYVGALNNDGETLELRDDEGGLIDLVVEGSWFTGRASPHYVSMERIDPQKQGTSASNWQDNNQLVTNGLDADGNPIKGTPKAANSPSGGPLTLPPYISQDLTLIREFSPYFVDQGVHLASGKTLTIDPGVVIKFYPGANVYLNLYGNLEALGTEAHKIVFTSLRDDDYGGNTHRPGQDFTAQGEPLPALPGDWKNIYFRETSHSQMNHVLIRYGGYQSPSGGGNAALIVNRGELVLTDSLLEKNKDALWLNDSDSSILRVEFRENQGTSVAVGGGSPLIQDCLFRHSPAAYGALNISQGTPQIRNNVFEDNRLPISVSQGANPSLTRNQGQNNETNAIQMNPSGPGLPSGTVIEWQPNQGLPYLVSGFFWVPDGVTLKIAPGVVVKVLGFLGVRGELLAEGSQQEPIIVTSFYDDQHGGDTNGDGGATLAQPGDWEKVWLTSSAIAVLKNVELWYAGKGGAGPLTIDPGAQLEQENVTIFP